MTRLEPVVLGLDPGKSGAVARLDGTTILAWDIPLAGDSIDVPGLARLVRDAAPDFVVIEAVGARPAQGLSSTFTFGKAFGTAIGVIGALEIPINYVTPSAWKRAYKLVGKEKDAARQLAINTWPASDLFSRKKDCGRADAAILALYGRDFLWRRTAA